MLRNHGDKGQFGLKKMKNERSQNFCVQLYEELTQRKRMGLIQNVSREQR